MPSLPLPFFVALLLLLLFAFLLRNKKKAPLNPAFISLLLLSAVQSLLVGLRWGYDIKSVQYVMPFLAALMPPLVYYSVITWIADDTPLWPKTALHLLPALGIALLTLVAREALDLGLITIFLVYAIAILFLMRAGPDTLSLTPFERTVPVYWAILFSAFVLVLSAGIDTFVFFDFAILEGRYARQAIALGNLSALAILVIAAAAIGKERANREAAPCIDKADPGGEAEILAHVRRLMDTQQIFRECDLTLNRLARKIGIPARQISNAINRITGKNVSQYVNDYRIAEACRSLRETDLSVTQIMLDVGFLTKSNFNREFRRVTDTSPLAWRGKDSKGANGKADKIMK